MKQSQRTVLALLGGIALLGAAPAAFAQAGNEKPKQEHKEKQPGKQDEHKDHKQEGKKDAKAAAKVGQPAPSFQLTDTDGKTHKLADYKGKIVVLEWFNPGCPVVKMHHEKNTTMKDTQAKFKDKNVVWLAINSGAEGQQGYGQEANAEAKKDWSLAYPILLDETGTTGRAYGAKTTPHMFIINEQGTLVYAGAIDNGSGGKVGDVNYVEDALTQVLAKETVSPAETKSYGCPVKYGKQSN